MRIITVNLPVSYLKAIDSLIGDQGLYPSRSELIRVAVRDFLIRELEAAKSFAQYSSTKSTPSHLPPEIETNFVVHVPVNDKPVDGITEYKTYKIVKK